MSFLKPSRRESEQIRIHEIRFLGEQDGSPERLLKDRLADLFRRDESVSKAYLVRVDFGEGKEASVALALRTRSGPDNAMAERVGVIFANVFNEKEHLDIMFLTDHQESKLTKVCQPFFEESNRG